MKDFVAKLKRDAPVPPVFAGIQRVVETQPDANDLFAPPTTASVMHIDMDCFFVSVAIRSRPELQGMPVVVTHSKGKGPSATDPAQFKSYAEIASASYEARMFGIKNGMLLHQALKLCPALEMVTYAFDEYREVSRTLYETLAEYTLNIEAVSCDELYADLRPTLDRVLCPLPTLVGEIRGEIARRTECAVSAGLGPNKLVARLATKFAKPNGQFIVEADEVGEFIKGHKLVDLPGVGYAMGEKLAGLRVETCAELQAVSLERLRSVFGVKTGEFLFKACRGEDDRVVKNAGDATMTRKSISVDVNYGIRLNDDREAGDFIEKLAREIRRRMVDAGVRARTLTLKLMTRQADAPVETKKFLGHGICDAASRSATLRVATNDAAVIASECKSLLRQLRPSVVDIRGVGIAAHRLEGACSTGGGLDAFFVNKAATSDAAPVAHVDEAGIVTSSPILLPPLSEIDPEVLRELPSQLRHEIEGKMRAPKQKELLRAAPKPRKGEKQKVLKRVGKKAKPTGLLRYFRPTREAEVVLVEKAPVTEEEEQDGLLRVSSTYDEVRAAIDEWFASEDAPEPDSSDLVYVADFLCKLVRRRKIAQAHRALKYLRWKVRRERAQWLAAIDAEVVARAQAMMADEFGGKTMLLDE